MLEGFVISQRTAGSHLFVPNPEKTISISSNMTIAAFRKKAINVLHSSILIFQEKKASQRLAKQLDKLIWEAYHDRQKYREKMQQITYNVSINGKYLLSRYSPAELLDLTDKQLAHGTVFENITNDYERNLRQLDSILQSTEGLQDLNNMQGSVLKCSNPRCTNSNISWTAVQTRSADEPMTLFCHCKNCGSRWKM